MVTKCKHIHFQHAYVIEAMPSKSRNLCTMKCMYILQHTCTIKVMLMKKEMNMLNDRSIMQMKIVNWLT